MNRDSFADLHPVTSLLYFSLVVGLTCFFTHPLCLGISLACAGAYVLYLGKNQVASEGIKLLKFRYMLPLVLLTAVFNPLFNHQGQTILGYLPDGNPLTLESIFYGVAASIMLVTVLIWFSCFTSVMTGEKFVYLFGRLLPALSLTLAMALRFVPRFQTQLQIIVSAQKGLRKDLTKGRLLTRAHYGLKILSILITWALENAVETASNMKNRGYGLPGRTAFSIYRFDRRDMIMLGYIVVCLSLIMVGALFKTYDFLYFPSIHNPEFNYFSLVSFTAYLSLNILPVIFNFKEDLMWKRIASKTSVSPTPTGTVPRWTI